MASGGIDIATSMHTTDKEKGHSWGEPESADGEDTTAVLCITTTQIIGLQLKLG